MDIVFNMRSYELAVVLKTTTPEAQRKKVLESVKDWLKNATVTNVNDWGIKAFEYPIQKEQSGHYAIYSFETDTALPEDLEKKVLGNDTIIRHLLVRKK